MKRALALAAAVAMVVLAVVVRSAIDDDAGGPDLGDLVLVCAPELVDACRALGDGVAVEVQDPADTLASIVSGDLGDDVDGWFTTSAWAEVLSSRQPDALASVQVAAATQPVVLADPDRADAIERLCAGVALWRCLGDHAGRPWSQLEGDPRWGALRTGVPDADSATGLGVLASIAAGYFGSTDFATNDFSDGTFASWLAGLAATATSDADPLGTLVTRRGTYSAAAGTEARATVIGQERPRLTVAPRITIQATLIGFGRDDLPGVAAAHRVLGEAGWMVMDDGDELRSSLKPGVLAALYTLWTEVAG